MAWLEWRPVSQSEVSLSRLKYPNIYWRDWDDILYRHSWSPEDESHWLWWSPVFSWFATRRVTLGPFSEISHIYHMDWHKILFLLFMFLRWCILMTFVISWHFLQWNLWHRVVFLSEFNPITLVVPWLFPRCHHQVKIIICPTLWFMTTYLKTKDYPITLSYS